MTRFKGIPRFAIEKAYLCVSGPCPARILRPSKCPISGTACAAVTPQDWYDPNRYPEAIQKRTDFEMAKHCREKGVTNCFFDCLDDCPFEDVTCPHVTEEHWYAVRK